MSDKHTPVPWRAIVDSAGVRVVDGAGSLVASIHLPDGCASTRGERESAWPELGCLIAAAPDLLDAAIEARAWCCGEKAEKSIGGFCTACTALSAAIAKATGQ